MRYRTHIFTLNYDPILYFEILRNKSNFFDGFIYKKNRKNDNCLLEFYNDDTSEKTYLKQEYIACKLKSNNKRTNIYFMHGSWFVVHNNQYELRKLNFNQDDDCIEMLFSGWDTPFFILEDRWKVKKKLIDGSDYFSFCYKKIKEEIKGDILIFGCSFETDNHVIDALKTNDQINKIYITYVDDNFNDGLKKLFNNKEIIPVPIEKNVIWTSGSA